MRPTGRRSGRSPGPRRSRAGARCVTGGSLWEPRVPPRRSRAGARCVRGEWNAFWRFHLSTARRVSTGKLGGNRIGSTWVPICLSGPGGCFGPAFRNPPSRHTVPSCPGPSRSLAGTDHMSGVTWRLREMLYACNICRPAPVCGWPWPHLQLARGRCNRRENPEETGPGRSQDAPLKGGRCYGIPLFGLPTPKLSRGTFAFFAASFSGRRL